jgi:hypothetical protein
MARVCLLILLCACARSGAPSPDSPAPGGALLLFAPNASPPNGTRLVLTNATEPPLPQDLVALSGTYALEPRGAALTSEFEVGIPYSGENAELYASDGGAWSRVDSIANDGLLRARLRSVIFLVAARTRPLVWHEVEAPRGGLSSFAFVGHTIYAVSAGLGPMVSVDGGETFRPLDKAEHAPKSADTAFGRWDPDHAFALPHGGTICAFAAAGSRLFAALDDGTVRFTEDQGATWQDYSGGLPLGPQTRATALASDGANVFASIAGRTFKARAR